MLWDRHLSRWQARALWGSMGLSVPLPQHLALAAKLLSLTFKLDNRTRLLGCVLPESWSPPASLQLGFLFSTGSVHRPLPAPFVQRARQAGMGWEAPGADLLSVDLYGAWDGPGAVAVYPEQSKDRL